MIIEIIMNLRAKDREKQQNYAQRKYYVGKMISSNHKHQEEKKQEQKQEFKQEEEEKKEHETRKRTLSPMSNEFAMYQKMLSMGFENAIAFNASYHSPSDIKQTIEYAKTHRKSFQLDENHLNDDNDDDDVKVKEYNNNNNYYSSKQREKYKLPQFVKEEDDSETFLVDSCDFAVSGCNSFKRINYILYKYKEWMMNDDKKIGFYDILNYNYPNASLLDDYHHLIFYHDFDQIHSSLFINCFDDNPNHVTGCKSLVRNNRNRLSKYKNNHQLLYYDTQSIQVNVEQIMDMIHCYFLHSYHLGLSLTSKEFVYIHSNNDNNNDSSDDDDDDDDDNNNNDMNGDTVKIQNIQKIVNRKRKRIEYLRGTDRLMNDNKFTTKIQNDNNYNRNLLIDEQIGIEYEYYDKNKKFYVNAMYNSFREEILELIPMNEWNVLKLRAQDMKNKKYSKLLMADDIDNGCRIEEGSLMYIEHLLSIMIYCNFDGIQSEFVNTCFNLSIKHNKFHHFGKRLFESVWVFGSTTNSSDIFYHCFSTIGTGNGNKNGSICFSSISNCCISLPLSTSSKIEVLLNYGGCFSENGIILQLKQNGIYSTMKYFDCEWISDFGGEAELLFYDNNLNNNHTFNINSIISIKLTEYGQDYRDYLICLNIIDKIFNAGYHFGINQLNSIILDTTVDLLNCELNYHVTDHIDHENIPNYILNLIHSFCINLKLIKINWPDLIHYYSFITSFLCYKENVFINLRVIIPIFINCQRILIHGGNPSLLQLNHNKMDYIYSFLYQNKNRINLKLIEICSISDSSTLSFKLCIKQYQQRFQNIKCKLFIQNPKLNGAPQSLIIQCID